MQNHSWALLGWWHSHGNSANKKLWRSRFRREWKLFARVVVVVVTARMSALLITCNASYCSDMTWQIIIYGLRASRLDWGRIPRPKPHGNCSLFSQSNFFGTSAQVECEEFLRSPLEKRDEAPHGKSSAKSSATCPFYAAPLRSSSHSHRRTSWSRFLVAWRGHDELEQQRKEDWQEITF